jgi:hypothetical protein
MRYAALIYTDEKADAVPGTSDFETVMKEYMAFGEEAGGAGVIGGGEALQPTATATTVRVENGQTLTTDGPFAETKEQLGGFYLLDVPDLDAAIAWAAKIPGAWHGRVEVRPVMDFSGDQPA